MAIEKKIFKPAFDPSMQPGFQTRCKSLDGFFGTGMISETRARPDRNDILASESCDLRAKYGSNQVPQVNPMYWLQKKGLY